MLHIYIFYFLFFLTTLFSSISNYLHLFLFSHTLSSLTFYLSLFIVLHTSFSLLILFTFPFIYHSYFFLILHHYWWLIHLKSVHNLMEIINFVRIWAYEQPLCSNYFYYVNINLSLFILEFALLCMLKPHYGILCIKMIRANHFPFFYFRIFLLFLHPKLLFVIFVWALTITDLILSVYLLIFLLFEPQFKEIFLDSLFGYILYIFCCFCYLVLKFLN